MEWHFKISEFNITGKDIPEDIADKILLKHIVPMFSVRKELGLKIWASKKSGYRPKWWEKLHGRSGDSQHTFEGDGAVDWTCEDFENNYKKLLELMLKYTNYTRFAIYKGFIHADYKYKGGGVQIFKSNDESEWELIKTIKK